MNFINAHKIVHDYSGAIGRHRPKEALLYYPISYLSNSKDEIIDAYKLMFAHMIFFHTRTQDEYKQYYALLRSIDFFIDDSKYNDIINCNGIINAKGILAKWRNKTALPYVREKLIGYLDEMSNLGLYPYRINEIDDYFDTMQKKYLEIRDIFKSEKVKQGDLSTNTYYKYCTEYGTVNNFVYEAFQTQ